jgi:hypothetical protein
MSEWHFNRVLNREPDETVSEAGFETVAELVRQAEELAGTVEQEVGGRMIAEADIRPGYTVQRYDGPDGLVTVHIGWMEGEDFVSLSMRNDYGRRRNKVAGSYTKMSKIGMLIEERALTTQDLADEAALILDAVERNDFRPKKIIPKILLAA